MNTANIEIPPAGASPDNARGLLLRDRDGRHD
jgi:hypothetical protein